MAAERSAYAMRLAGKERRLALRAKYDGPIIKDKSEATGEDHQRPIHSLKT
jgi:hypothetical protein